MRARPSSSLPQRISSGRSRRLADWNPEDTAAWEDGDDKIARRNLICTMAGDHVAFSIWSLWSVMVLFMPASVYGFSASDKLLLGAVATLTGGCVRIPYTLGIITFGGRNICTFGSWIGFSFTFGQVLQVNFLASGETARHASLHAAQIAFVGPLLGSLARIYGGRLADRVGGGRVTLGVLGGMTLAAGMLVAISTVDGRNAGTTPAALTGCVIGFMILFILSGMGNGSVFKLIPSVYDARSRTLDTSEAQRRQWARAKSGSLIGICSAVGALGGVGISLALRESYLRSGTETSAYWLFLASYVISAILTWTMYVRPPAPSPGVSTTALEPSSARV